MKVTKKRLLSLLLAAVMALTLLPVMAFAEEAPGMPLSTPVVCTVTEGCTLAEGHEGECILPVVLGAAAPAADTHKVALHRQQSGMGTADKEGVVSNKYYLVAPDGSLNADGADENNYNIYYDEAAARLTINNLRISSDKMLLVPGGTTLEVLGTNQIAIAQAALSGGGIGVVSDGDLTITGTGSLYLSSKSYSGIGWATQDNAFDGRWPTGGVQIKGDVDLTVDHFGATTCISTHEGDVVIGENAVVHLDPRKGNDNTFSMAFFNGESITVQDSAQVFSTAAIDTFGTDSAGEYGRINLLGNSVLTFTVENEGEGRAMHAGGGIEVAKDVKVTVSSNTKDSQAIASNAGDITIAGEVEVNMLNESSETSVALYAKNIGVTGKLTVNGGTYAMYVENQVDFNGADVKVTDSKVGVMQKAQITNSFIEMDTTMRAFGTTPTVSLTKGYAVFAGPDADTAVFYPHKNGAVEPNVWTNTYVRIEAHTCTYDRQVISEQYKATDATCTAAATYYKSCVCGAKGTETFASGQPDASRHTNLVKTEAKAATHLEAGNKEYWYCDGCGKYFSDAAGTTEISFESTVLPKLPGHTADGTGWHSDAENHWNTCECGEVLNKAAHTFGDWATTKPATATEAGSREKSCTACGYTVTESIPATGTGTGGGTVTTPTAPPKPNPETSTPQTGDPFSAWPFVGLLLIGAAGLATLLVVQAKRRKNAE